MSIGDSNSDQDPTEESGDLIAASSALLTLLLSTSSVEGFMSELAADVIVPAASCGITARTNGHPVTVATGGRSNLRRGPRGPLPGVRRPVTRIEHSKDA